VCHSFLEKIVLQHLYSQYREIAASCEADFSQGEGLLDAIQSSNPNKV